MYRRLPEYLPIMSGRTHRGSVYEEREVTDAAPRGGVRGKAFMGGRYDAS